MPDEAKIELCEACENGEICVIRKNSEEPITKCCLFCIHCKSYNWSCRHGPKVFSCYFDKKNRENFSALDKHSCKRFKRDPKMMS